jgi:hypothetical protein
LTQAVRLRQRRSESTLFKLADLTERLLSFCGKSEPLRSPSTRSYTSSYSSYIGEGSKIPPFTEPISGSHLTHPTHLTHLRACSHSYRHIERARTLRHKTRSNLGLPSRQCSPLLKSRKKRKVSTQHRREPPFVRRRMSRPAGQVDPTFWTDQLFDDDSEMQGMELASDIRDVPDQSRRLNLVDSSTDAASLLQQNWRGRYVFTAPRFTTYGIV